MQNTLQSITSLEDLRYILKCRKDLVRKYEELQTQIDDEPLTISEITRLVNDAMRNRSAKVYLFGSHARGTAAPKSDIDLVVDSEDEFLTLSLMGEIEYMCGNEIDYKCQAITISQLTKADDEFRHSVEKDMVLIYEKKLNFCN